MSTQTCGVPGDCICGRCNTQTPVVGAAAPTRGEQSGLVQGDAATSSLDSSSTTGPLTSRVLPFTLVEDHPPAPRLSDAEYMTERRFRIAKNALDGES